MNTNAAIDDTSYLVVNKSFHADIQKPKNYYEALTNLINYLDSHKGMNMRTPILVDDGREQNFKLLDYEVYDSIFAWEERKGEIRFINPIIENNSEKPLAKLKEARDKEYLKGWQEIETSDEIVDTLGIVRSGNLSELYDGNYLSVDGIRYEVDAYPITKSLSMETRNCFTGICAWSEKKDECLELFRLIYSDEKLSQLLGRGIEGVNYTLEGNRIKEVLQSDGNPACQIR